jgi:O-antigen ligase
MLIPVISLFGIHIILFKKGNIWIVTLPYVYCGVLAAATLAIFIIKRHIHVEFGRAFWYVMFFMLMMAYAFLSLLWAMHLSESFNVLIYQFCGIAAAVFITATIRSFHDLTVFLRILTACYVIIIIFGVFEIYTGYFFFKPSELAYSLKDSYGFNFPYTVFYNTNDNASFVMMFAPFAVFTVIDWVKGWRGKLLGIFLGILVFFTLICSRARNCFVTIICFMTILLLVCLIKKNIRKYVKTVALIFATMPLAIVAVKLTAFKNGSVMSKINTINGADHSISQRLEITIGGLRMAKVYHFMGVGVGNSVPLMPYFSKLQPINLHDMPLQILVEYGIIIFALYLLMTVFLARDFVKLRLLSEKWRFFALICFLTLLAFQVVGLQSSDAMHIPALWMLFGIWFSAVKLFYQDGGTDSAALFQYKP